MINVDETLRRLRDKRRAAFIVPDFVPFTDLHDDIMRQVRDELNEMYSNGIISVKRTLNNQSIEILK